jgi:hypothetical protein
VAADVVSVEVERVSQQQIGVAGQSAPPGRLLAICELTGQVAGHRSTVQVVRPLRRVVGWAGRSQPARHLLEHRRRSWRCSALARLTRDEVGEITIILLTRLLLVIPGG